MAAAPSDDPPLEPDDAVARDPVEVLVEEYFRQRRRGDPSDPADFARRIPGRAAEFRALVAALDLLESAATATMPGAAPAALPPRIGRFRPLRRIGRGGMGVVYEAVDEELGRHVALKVLASHATPDGRAVERFRREAHAAAQLRHPHIVPLFGVGEDDGVHWIAMQLVDGTSLDAAARVDGAARMQPGEAARHGFALADALACAHAAGILHRDVKPSNVLLDRSGCAFITDFGLAAAEGAAAITATGESLGTPRYMAPEAFHGWADPRTDVWGVGVTLYELVAGRPAFDGTQRAQLLRQVCEVEPRPLRELVPGVPRDFATIVEHCLHKEPAARYASARELADDLRRHLAGEPIRARPPTLADRLASRVRRHRVGTALAAGALVVVVALLVAWGVTLRRTNDRLAREQARAEDSLAVAGEAIARVLDETSSDVVLRAPALDPLRQRLLAAALAFEQRLLAQQETDGSKRLDVAIARQRLGDVEWQLARFDASRAHYEAAAASLRALRDERGARDPAVAMPLAAALAGIACCARDRGDLAAAEASLREGLAVIAAATGGAPASVDDAHHLVHATTLLAELLTRDGRAGDGATLLAATLPGAAASLEAVDTRPQALRVARDAWAELAAAQQHAGEAPAAIASLRHALAVSRRLVARDDPDVRDIELDAARRAWLGALLLAAGMRDEAAPLLAQARDDLADVAARWPMVPEFRRDLADALVRDAAARANDPAPEVDAQLVRAVALADGCLAARPDDVTFAWAALAARNALVTRRQDAGDLDGAVTVARAATRWLDERGTLPATWPAANFEQAAVAWYDRAAVERELGLLDDALAATEKAAALAGRLVDGGRESPAARLLLLRIGSLAGSLHLDRGAPDAAVARWTEVEEAARPQLAGADFHADARAGSWANGDVALLLVEALNLDANVRARHAVPAGAANTPDFVAATARLDEALATATRLVEAWPASAPAAAALGMARGDAGFLAVLQSDPPRARAAFAQALPLLARAIASEPSRRDWRRALAIALDGLAGSLQPCAGDDDVAALQRLVEAATTAADAAPADGGVQAEAARVLARAAAVRHGPLATRFGAPARDPWAEAAMARLAAARAAGYGDAARLERDPAFDSLRTRDDWRRLVAALKEAGR